LLRDATSDFASLDVVEIWNNRVVPTFSSLTIVAIRNYVVDDRDRAIFGFGLSTLLGYIVCNMAAMNEKLRTGGGGGFCTVVGVSVCVRIAGLQKRRDDLAWTMFGWSGSISFRPVCCPVALVLFFVCSLGVLLTS
jgi:hypothetical protein